MSEPGRHLPPHITAAELAAAAPQRIEIHVRYRGGAYVTRTIRGQRTSCTASAEDAACLLAKKLAGAGGEVCSVRPRKWPVVSEYLFDALIRPEDPSTWRKS